MTMDDETRKLLSFVNQPSSDELGDSRWPAIEARIGIAFPTRFKRLVERFGDHNWNQFAVLLNPLSGGFEERLDAILSAERTTRTQFPEQFLFPLHPESEGLFPWATTDNGDTLFWIRRGSGRWPTLIKGARAPEFEVNFCSCDVVLYQIAAGTIRSRILPHDLAGEK
jgi:hypothetical protein